MSSSLAIINIVNFYLDQPDVDHQLRAADARNPDLEGYIYEAMRKTYGTALFSILMLPSNLCIGIDPPFRGIYRMYLLFLQHFQSNPFICTGESLADQEVGSLKLFKGQRVFVNLAYASQDVSSPNPRCALRY